MQSTTYHYRENSSYREEDYFSIAKEVEQAGAELDHIAMKTFNLEKLRDVLLGENKIRYKHLKSIRF